MSAERLITNREALRRLLMGANDERWAKPAKAAKAEKPERLPRTREAARKATERVAATVAGWRR